MNIYVSLASGRGECRMCRKPIKENAVQVVANTHRGYSSESGRAHLSCITKQARRMEAKKN